MSLVAEDGTGVEDANSYVDLDPAETYFSDRAITDWTDSDEDKEAALIRATQYIEATYRGQWQGTKANAGQALSWPRKGVVDEDGNDVADDAIPTLLVQATCEAALRELLEPRSLTDDTLTGIKTVKAGPVDIEFQQGQSIGTDFTILDNLLSPLLTQASGNTSFLLRA